MDLFLAIVAIVLALIAFRESNGLRKRVEYLEFRGRENLNAAFMTASVTSPGQSVHAAPPSPVHKLQAGEFVCRNCGAPASPSDGFCGRCGMALAELPPV